VHVIYGYVPCAICKTAKAKRFCPGIREEICPGCCGAGRERTIDCPLNCEYLAEAHRHEKKPESDPSAMPGVGVRLEDDFLQANEFLIVLVGSAMCEAFRPHTNALDTDAVAALDALAETGKARAAGVVYEAKPVNPIAADMFEAVEARIADVRRRMEEADGKYSLPDPIVEGVVLFLQRVAFGLNNGRPKCKAFLVFLSQFYVNVKDAEAEAEEAGGDEPLVVL